MTTFESAKEMGYMAVLEKIQAASLKEYGLTAEPFADKIFRANAGDNEVMVYAGLNNADIDCALLALLKDDPEKVFDGIEIAAMLVNASAKFLYLPVWETALAEELKAAAEAHKIIIVNDIINVRETENDLRMHIATAADLADLIAGTYTEGAYICTADGLKKVPAETPVSELVSLDGAKAVYLGYQYYTPEEAAGLKAADATNAVIRVLTDKDCIVAETVKMLTKDRQASCGRCVFCREGLNQIEFMYKEITQARGKTNFASLTDEIGDACTYNTLCTVGQEAPKAALSAMKKFASEFEAHIKKNKCPAEVCTAFVHIYIDPHTCTGCGECMDVCPAECIEGKPNFIHMIDEFDCTKCGKCIEVCEEEAIVKTAGKLPKLPNRLIKVGKFKKH